MLTTKSLPALIGAALIGLAGVANATIIAADETFSPTATNGGAGAIGTHADFTARGFQSNLTSLFTILGTSGTASVTETGNIFITSFQDSASNTVSSGVGLPGALGTDYTLGATFSLTGTGTWSSLGGGSNQITLSPVGATLSVNLYANYTGSDPTTGTLIGTASLDPSAPQVAFAQTFANGLGNGATGAALTSLTAGLDFTPQPGYSGPGGFFQTIPPQLLLSVGNAGGNTLNTVYSVSGTTVTIVTPPPGANGNQGTANVTFAHVIPEPGALSLIGIALLGIGVVGLRKVNIRGAA